MFGSRRIQVKLTLGLVLISDAENPTNAVLGEHLARAGTAVVDHREGDVDAGEHLPHPDAVSSSHFVDKAEEAEGVVLPAQLVDLLRLIVGEADGENDPMG